MEYQLCRHIKTNGTQCGSPALDHHSFCFFHDRLHRRHAAFRHVPAPRGSGSLQLELSPLEDRESIQAALSLIIHALAAGQLDNRRATALFYGLQLASNNAARLSLTPYPPDVLTETTSDPEGLELALPGNTRTLTTSVADELYEEEDPQPEEETEDDREEMKNLWDLANKGAPEHANPWSSAYAPDLTRSRQVVNASAQTAPHTQGPAVGYSDHPPL